MTEQDEYLVLMHVQCKTVDGTMHAIVLKDDDDDDGDDDDDDDDDDGDDDHDGDDDDSTLMRPRVETLPPSFSVT